MAKQIRYDHFLHGGDYNPEQWLDRPDILKKDIEYFKKAHINTVSMGMFSWAVLEPEEGSIRHCSHIPKGYGRHAFQGFSSWCKAPFRKNPATSKRAL